MRDTTVYSQRDMENKTVYQMDFESILQKFSLIEYLILTKWNLETSEIFYEIRTTYNNLNVTNHYQMKSYSYDVVLSLYFPNHSKSILLCCLLNPI